MTGRWIASGMLALVLGACTSAPESTPLETVALPPPGPTTESPYAAEFGFLADLAGTRWRGEPGEADKEHGLPADISEWSWDLGGTVLVNRHALEDGSYGGITYVQHTQSTGDLDYVYITSAGFRTTGSITMNEDGSWTSYEAVEGLDEIIGVRSTGHIAEDGKMISVSEFETAEGWIPGHSFQYAPTTQPMPSLTGRLVVE